MKKHVKVLVLEDTESIGDILPVDLQKKITRETDYEVSLPPHRVNHHKPADAKRNGSERQDYLDYLNFHSSKIEHLVSQDPPWPFRLITKFQAVDDAKVAQVDFHSLDSLTSPLQSETISEPTLLIDTLKHRTISSDRKVPGIYVAVSYDPVYCCWKRYVGQMTKFDGRWHPSRRNTTATHISSVYYLLRMIDSMICPSVETLGNSYQPCEYAWAATMVHSLLEPQSNAAIWLAIIDTVPTSAAAAATNVKQELAKLENKYILELDTLLYVGYNFALNDTRTKEEKDSDDAKEQQLRLARIAQQKQEQEAKRVQKQKDKDDKKALKKKERDEKKKTAKATAAAEEQKKHQPRPAAVSATSATPKRPLATATAIIAKSKSYQPFEVTPPRSLAGSRNSDSSDTEDDLLLSDDE